MKAEKTKNNEGTDLHTSCNVLIGNHLAYHCKYGESMGVGNNLAHYLANVNANLLNRPQSGGLMSPRDLDEMAYCICHKGGVPGGFGDYLGWDSGYKEVDSRCLNDDISYLYIIIGDHDIYRLYCVDVNGYLIRHPEHGRGCENSLFNMDFWTLRQIFCCPEYEVILPRIEIPLGKRRYMLAQELSYDEAKCHGLINDDLKYGHIESKSGIFRVRNAKRPKRWRK